MRKIVKFIYSYLPFFDNYSMYIPAIIETILK